MERVRTIEEMYCSHKTAPEEISFRVKSCRQANLDISTVKQILQEQLQWESDQFPHVHYFTHTLQVDEYDDDLFHVRRVWIAHDKAGNEIVSERKALQEMGIERPDANQKEGRFNNAKMTYTARCREHLNQLCATYNLDMTIESKGKKRHKKSLQALDSPANRCHQARNQSIEGKAERCERRNQAGETENQGKPKPTITNHYAT